LKTPEKEEKIEK